MRVGQISFQVRNLIIRDRKNNDSFRNIAERYSVSVGAIQNIWKKYQTNGIVGNLKGSGRKRATTPRDDAMIVRIAKKEPKITSRSIVEMTNLPICDRTVRRRLRENGLKNTFAAKRPFISLTNKRKRLNFAKKFINNPLNYWKTVLWSDESKFEIFGRKRRSRVWRKSDEAFKEANIQSTIKYGGGSVMLWGCFSWHGVGNLAKVEGIMNAEGYIEILNENLEESLLKLGLEENFIFQQDNDPKHKAKLTCAFLKASRIKLLEWPPQSPDLNPIENLWNYLDGKVNKTNVTNKENYYLELQKAWEQLDPDYLKNLVESMPRRLQAVIKAKGSNTKY